MTEFPGRMRCEKYNVYTRKVRKLLTHPFSSRKEKKTSHPLIQKGNKNPWLNHLIERERLVSSQMACMKWMRSM